MPEPLRRTHSTLPFIPPPEEKEIPVHEYLLKKAEFQDQRPLQVKHPQLIRHVDFNRMYGTQQTVDGWRYVVDNFAKGTLTTSAGATVSTTITFALTPTWRLEQFPGATQLFFCIRQFALTAQAPGTLTTVGALDIVFQDTVGGQQIPLGDVASNVSLNLDLDRLIPTPITDPSNPTVGNLLVGLTAAATTGTYNWQLSFSGAYLLPNLRGYSREERYERHR